MGTLIRFTRPDGKSAPGWYAEPKEGGAKAGIVLIQEWWGLNEQIQGIGGKFAGLGYRVLIPDLYRGKRTLAVEEARHMMSALDFTDAATQDMRGAVRYVKRGSGRVAVVGYCMGGALAFLTAMKVPDADAAVVFYGAPPGMADEAGKIRIPILGHFAMADSFFPAPLVREYEAKMKEGRVDAEVHWYDAGHAFCNETGDAFNREACETAWRRTVDFLEKQLN